MSLCGYCCIRIKYYNGCLFHTVQKDFTAQTGDPTGTGTGGDSVFKYVNGTACAFSYWLTFTDLFFINKM